MAHACVLLLVAGCSTTNGRGSGPEGDASAPADSALRSGDSDTADVGLPPPVITSFTLPPTASIGSDGNYDLTAHISFTSPSSPVVTIHVVSKALHVDTTIPIEPASTVQNGPLPLTFPSDNASGTHADVEISVIDEAGAESPPVAGTVVLE